MSSGSSVAKAKAAKVSIIKLTQSIYIALIGGSVAPEIPATQATTKAATLTVN